MLSIVWEIENVEYGQLTTQEQKWAHLGEFPFSNRTDVTGCIRGHRDCMHDSRGKYMCFHAIYVCIYTCVHMRAHIMDPFF